MHRTTIFTLLFAIGVASAFALPTGETLARSEGTTETTALTTGESDESVGLTAPTGTNNSTAMKSNNFRWIIRGIVTELYHNVFLRQIKLLRSKFGHNNNITDITCRQRPNHEIAIVTGATGGIGSHMAHELAYRGYDVVVAARDVTRGKKLVDEIKSRLADLPSCKNNASQDFDSFPIISFVEYHADNPQSAMDVVLSVKELIKSNENADADRRVSLLINNAGIMGKSKQLTMKVNLLGPVLLTLALLPLMDSVSCDASKDDGRKIRSGPTVINVGSSAHLRATHVIDEGIILEKNETYIKALPNIEDKDLSTYAQSKLALMQFSTLMRSKSKSQITFYDAHPGLVWTPLLRNHIGDKATNILHKTGLANLIYKTPLEGAQAIIGAVDCTVQTTREEQVYFENGQPGGYATHESRDISAALKLWKEVIELEIDGMISLPEELLNLASES